MRLDPDFVLQDMQQGVSVLVPTGAAGKRYRGIIRLNETAAFLVQALRKQTTEAELLEALGREYEGTEDQFRRSIRITLEKLREAGALIE